MSKPSGPPHSWSQDPSARHGSACEADLNRCDDLDDPGEQGAADGPRPFPPAPQFDVEGFQFLSDDKIKALEDKVKDADAENKALKNRIDELSLGFGAQLSLNDDLPRKNKKAKAGAPPITDQVGPPPPSPAQAIPPPASILPAPPAVGAGPGAASVSGGGVAVFSLPSPVPWSPGPLSPGLIDALGDFFDDPPSVAAGSTPPDAATTVGQLGALDEGMEVEFNSDTAATLKLLDDELRHEAAAPAHTPVVAIDASNITATSDVIWGTAAQGVAGGTRVKCPFAKADGAVCNVDFTKRKWGGNDGHRKRHHGHLLL